MDETVTAETVETEDLSPAAKLAAILGKAESDKGDDKGDDKDKFDDDFKSKMDRYMKSEEGKKKYMCKKAEDGEEPLSKAEEYLQNGLGAELDDQRQAAADDGRGEEPLGYFLHLHEGNAFFKAQFEMIASNARLEKAVRELIAAQKEDAVLTRATAEAFQADMQIREDLAKAEGLKPLAVRGRQQGTDMGPPPSDLNADQIDVKPALEALSKAAADASSDLTPDRAIALMHYVKTTRGNLGVLPDGVPEEIRKYTNKEAA